MELKLRVVFSLLLTHYSVHLINEPSRGGVVGWDVEMITVKGTGEGSLLGLFMPLHSGSCYWLVDSELAQMTREIYERKCVSNLLGD